ncbi:hypothetical protein ES332_A07G221200v1 [Gossypium tomentosum]|uniref:Uncharacterized protein n=1 Tax=Gossypium tomentosum TaxID=34277 RepID=A0A5D2PVU3_GOSTO|nr:hypothetical protein ES332_A07G221200v1 [Gossypium tomentosum]
MGKKMNMNPLFIFLWGTVFTSTVAEPVKGKQELLGFIQHIHHSRSLKCSKDDCLQAGVAAKVSQQWKLNSTKGEVRKIF